MSTPVFFEILLPTYQKGIIVKFHFTFKVEVKTNFLFTLVVKSLEKND
jgi:hypothetical protein